MSLIKWLRARLLRRSTTPAVDERSERPWHEWELHTQRCRWCHRRLEHVSQMRALCPERLDARLAAAETEYADRVRSLDVLRLDDARNAAALRKIHGRES